MYRVRSNPFKNKKRYHYNSKGKAKIKFKTLEDAIIFLKKKHLQNYTIYLCKYCNNYHIAHNEIYSKKRRFLN